MMNIRNVSVKLLFLLLSTVSFYTVSAQKTAKEILEIDNKYILVNDFANVLTNREEQELTRKLIAYNDTSSVQITIVTLATTGNMDIGVFAYKIGDKWGVGQAKTDNGAVVVAAIDDRKVFIAPGGGYEGVLTDGMAGEIVRNIIVPHFKRQEYYQGFDGATTAIMAAANGEYDAVAKKRMPAWLIIILIIVVYFILWAVSKKNGGGGNDGGYVSRRGYSDLATGMLLGNILSGGSGSSGGFGGSSGGGFGGFGGGSFGGGGAGGSW